MIGDKSFSTIVRASDPIVRDHTVHGLRIMPGVTFLDLAFRAALGAGFAPETMELRKVLFIEPLAVSADCDRKLVLRFVRCGAHWKINARSQHAREGKALEEEWQENASMELHAECPEEFPGVTFNAGRPSAASDTLDRIYDHMRRVGIEHGSFMRCAGRAHSQGKWVHAELRASAEAAALSEHFYFLPSLLDTATGLSAFAPGGQARFLDHPCVPIYIERFRAWGRLGSECVVSLACPEASTNGDADLTRDDRIDFFARSGGLIARMEGISYKRIRSAAAWQRLAPTELSRSGAVSLAAVSRNATLSERIRATLREIVRTLPGKQIVVIDDDAGFYESGLESADLLAVVREIEKRVGREFYPTLLFEHPSISALADYLEREAGESPAWKTREVNEPKGAVASVRCMHPAVRADSSRDGVEAIAIVGMAGRYPKARTLDEFWENLRIGRDCIEEIPADRWDHSKYPGCYARWGGFIEDHDRFDPLFFNLAPREAELMDPAERLFLQVVWETLEDAGYTRSRLKQKLAARNGKAGVFAGCMWGGYDLWGAEHLAAGNSVASTSGHWSLANRVSYFFDFAGPSVGVDTACSSSLSAIHLACQSIRAGECDVAIAGGANLTLHPSKYVLLCQLKMASRDGRCRSFGADGDGYVPGEGVGAVLLKRLCHALEDGDRVYGVIRGSAVNHGGRSNGYSVPNPNAQAMLIAEAFQKAGTEPATISYIEAHGTGTALGDPIEVAALTKAFQSDGPLKQSCAVGSLKSAVGHLEAAAGVAALTKVLLQLKHRALVPSLHAERLNPKIDFTRTPFHVQRETAEWAVPENLPRRAGISSFGVGGANAHIVVEEAPRQNGAAPSGNLLLIPVSAKSEEQLRALLRSLLKAVSSDEGRAALIEDIAWTLQVGREQMDWRAVFLASNVEDLGKQIDAFLRGELDSRTWTGSRNRSGATQARLDSVSELFSQRKLDTIASLWASGVEIEWERFSPPARIVSLPTYPFLRERYWFPNAAPILLAQDAASVRDYFTHVDEIEGRKLFRKVIQEEDRLLADHRVRGAAVLPGAAVLDMILRCAGRLWRESSLITVRNLVWLEPLRPNNGRLELEASIQPDGHSARFEVAGAGGVSSVRGRIEIPPEQPLSGAKFDVGKIRCCATVETAPDELYSRFARLGLEYGPAFRCLTALRGCKQEALGSFAISDDREEDRACRVLDAAFQTVLGIDGTARELFLPFSIGSVEFFAALPVKGLVHARLLASNSNSQRFDIDVADSAGVVLVQIRNFTLRHVEREAASELYFFRPFWKEGALARKEVKTDRVLLFADETVAFPIEQTSWVQVRAGSGFRQISRDVYEVSPGRATDFESLWNELKALGQLPDVVVNAWPFRRKPEDEMDDLVARSFGTLFSAVQTFVRVAPAHSARWIQVSPAGVPLCRMVSGFARTLAIEHPKHRCKVVELESADLRHLEAEFHEPLESWNSEVRFEHGRRYVREIRRESIPLEVSNLRADGVYLVTGGYGALSRIFARALADRGCPVVLMGRRESGPEPLPSGVFYERVDIAETGAVREMVDRIRAKYGRVRAVIHAAGVIEDGLIARKEADSWERVLRPKVLGSLALDDATARDDLDFFVLFSSLSALTGNLGQADYASANAFMDAFAEQREQMRARGLRHGRSISINWPWWKDGGMPLPEAAREMLARKYGLAPLDEASGIEAFFRILASECCQTAVAGGDLEKLEKWLGVIPAGEGTEDQAPLNRLTKITSTVLKVRVSDLDAETDLGEYGVDSVRLMEIVNEVEKAYGIVLEPSVVTEHPTLAKFSAYLTQVLADAPALAAEERGRTVLKDVEIIPASRATAKPQAIAIIGAAGRFANAPSLEDFWKQLAAGQCAVREVPADRWSISQLNGSASRWGSFVDGIDLFDPDFFQISEKDAAEIDPQQRILLEVTQELFDRAGYSRAEVRGRRVAVCLGAGQSDYIPNRTQLWPEAAGQRVIVNQLANMVAARVSDFYHLRGPSWTVDTACSASLVAIHQACQSLRLGESEMAIAGGIQLLIDPSYFVGFSQAGVLSKTGVCAVFDQKANGMVLGEGVGIVLLKRLEAALRDGDQVLGLVLGSATNNDGQTMGLTTPSVEAQREVIAAAISSAGVDPGTISYLEAHGTGTPLGDPIEIKAATQAFREYTAAKQFCGVGSVKSNIGHLLRAAGIASFLKVLCSLQNQMLPATLHCQQPHPRFRFADSPFFPVTQLGPWKSRHENRRAGISSFGFGGTNCHMILEQFNARAWKHDARRSPLPATVFKRKRFWLGSPAEDRNPENGNGTRNGNGNGHETDDLVRTLRQLRLGQISIEQAKSRM